MSAINSQIGGSHYKQCAIQPVEYIHANGLGYFEGNVLKYITRWRDKGGIADLEKAKHYIELLIELESNKANSDATAVESGEWIEWDGKTQPLDNDVVVEVKLRNRTLMPARPAKFYDWHNVGSHPGEIIAYRIIKD